MEKSGENTKGGQETEETATHPEERIGGMERKKN